ncbi:MAG: MBL fold metallo-hydrolase [Desulfurococcales archaeon]|nr:MBL fold metallo-hydrolase [Desulfurococcales archaeon]
MLEAMIVGAGGSAPPPGYGGPSLFLSTDNNNVVIDCGENCLSTLTLHGVDPCEINYVYITHVHIDHWAGLPSLGVKLIEKKCPYLKVFTHQDAYSELSSYLSIFMPSTLNLELEKISSGEKLFAGRYWGCIFKVYHKVPTYGVVFHDENDKPLLVYTSDTGYREDLVESIPKKPQVLFIEVTLPSNFEEVAETTGHLTVTQAIKIASLLNPSLIVPIHLSESSLKELLTKKLKNMIIPKDGLTISL